MIGVSRSGGLGCAAVVALIALAAAAPASATFPGSNGRLALSSAGDIFTVNPDGSGRLQLTNTADATESSPSYSADGERIVYVKSPTGGMAPPGSIWVMNADGSGQTEIATGGVGDSLGDPTFSPDGNTIAFTRGDGSATNIFSMSTDGSNQQPLTDFTNPQFATAPAYSPDGTKMLVSFRGGGPGSPSRIGIMDATGSTVVQVGTGAPAYDSAPDWSPNGAKITFQREFSLFEMNADGSGLLRLTQSLGPVDGSPVYSPQGPQFAFARTSGGAGEIRLGTSGIENGPTSPITTTTGSALPSVSWQALNAPVCQLGTVKPAKSGKKISVEASCSNEDATLTVEGSGKAPKSKPFSIPVVKVDIPAGGSAKVQVKLPKKPAKAIKKATKAGKKAKATLSVSFADGLGATTGENLRVKFKPKKRGK